MVGEGLGAKEDGVLCGWEKRGLGFCRRNSSPDCGPTVGLWVWSVNICLPVSPSLKWVDLDQRGYFGGWQTFSVKGLRANMLGLWAASSLLQLLNSAIVERKQPQKIRK